MNPRPARAAAADGAHGPPGAALKEIPLDVLLAVNDTLVRGLELNPNLVAVAARFVREARTAPTYRLWLINDRHPAMIRVAAGGAAT